MASKTSYTIVQHSGHIRGGKREFAQGLEVFTLTRAAHYGAVARAKGLLFGNVVEADNFAHAAMYPPGVEGLVPKARGTFSTIRLDDLPIYVPHPDDTKES